MSTGLRRGLDALIGSQEHVAPTDQIAMGFTWENDPDFPEGPTGTSLLAAVLSAEGANVVRIGPDRFLYFEGQGDAAVMHLVEERPAAIRTFVVGPLIEELGLGVAEDHGANLVEVPGGFECSLNGVRATGSTLGEAATRAWLLHLQSERG